MLASCPVNVLPPLIMNLSVCLAFMATLRSTCGHYMFVQFLSSFFFFLASAVADWMSTILLHMVWP